MSGPVIDPALREAVSGAMSWVDDERALDAVLAVVAKYLDAREQDALTALSLMVEERDEARDRIARAVAYVNDLLAILTHQED